MAVPSKASAVSDESPATPTSPQVVPLRPTALPAALQRVRDDLVRAVRRVCPRWLAADAEDLVQDALIRVWQAQQRAVDGAADTNASYLFRAAYSAVIDEIRRRRRRVATDERGDDALQSATSAGDMRRDIAIGEGISQCLERQNDDRRRALTLHLLGHSIEATGKLLGIATKNAENLIYRGLRHLRECLGELGFAP